MQIRYIIPQISTTVAQGLATGVVYQLLERFSLQRLAVPVNTTNPYINALPDAPVEDPTLKFSVLGTPILTNLVIGAGSYVDNNGVTQQWADIEIDNIIMTVSQRKKIVVTEIQGKDNDVKEYIGLRDYEIALQGGIFGGYNSFPIDTVKDLKKAMASPQPLIFASWWLQNLDIETVVAFEFDMPQTEGEYASQYFTGTVHSDVPTEVNITGGTN